MDLIPGEASVRQGTQQVSLCLLLTFLVTVTYVVNVREHIISSIRARQWRKLFLQLD